MVLRAAPNDTPSAIRDGHRGWDIEVTLAHPPQQGKAKRLPHIGVVEAIDCS